MFCNYIGYIIESSNSRYGTKIYEDNGIKYFYDGIILNDNDFDILVNNGDVIKHTDISDFEIVKHYRPYNYKSYNDSLIKQTNELKVISSIAFIVIIAIFVFSLYNLLMVSSFQKIDYLLNNNGAETIQNNNVQELNNQNMDIIDSYFK